jgi:hypothetical protein
MRSSLFYAGRRSYRYDQASSLTGGIPMPDQTSDTPVPDQDGQLRIDAEGKIVNEQKKGTVRFTGLHAATVRIIRTGEWPIGVDAKGGKNAIDAVWNMDNGYELPTDQFNAKQLEVLKADGMFSVVE